MLNWFKMSGQLKVYSWYFLQVYDIAKSGAKQKLVFKGHGNKNAEAAATCSKAAASAEELNRASSALKAILLSPNVKAEKSGKIQVA